MKVVINVSYQLRFVKRTQILLF